MKIVTLQDAPKMETPLGLDARVAASAPEAELVQFTLRPGEVIPPHPMPVRVFFVVLAGQGEITVGDRTDVVSRDQIVEIEPGVKRGWRAVGTETLRVLAVKTPRPVA